MTMWLLNAVSLSGYILFGFFVTVAMGRWIRLRIETVVKRLPRRSQLRHYLMFGLSAGFFSLLILRGCYLATVIIDTEFRADLFKPEHSISWK